MGTKMMNYFIPRRDLRTVTFVCGLAFTLGLAASLWREAKQQSISLLNASHTATMRMLSRDVDDLRQQLVRAIGEGDERAAGYRNLIFRQLSGQPVSVQDGAMKMAAIPIENAGSSVFRASMPRGNLVHVKITAEGGPVPLDESDFPLAKGEKNSKSAKLDGTNLVVTATTSVTPFWIPFAWLIFASAAFWMCLIALAARADANRRRRNLAARDWMQSAMTDFRFGRLPAPLDPILEKTEEGNLINQLSITLKEDMPHFLNVNNRMIDMDSRLGSWPMFQVNLDALLKDLNRDERFIVGKLHFGFGTSAREVAAGMAEELALAGDYIQCLYNDNTLVYAFRTEGQDSLLYGTFSPLRNLVDSDLLQAGNFEATLYVLNQKSNFASSDAILTRLDLAHIPAFGLRNPSKSPASAAHLILNEGFSAPRVTRFSLMQLLYLDTNLLHGNSAPIKRNESREVSLNKSPAASSKAVVVATPVATKKTAPYQMAPLPPAPAQRNRNKKAGRKHKAPEYQDAEITGVTPSRGNRSATWN
jgi:hypothetical protein